MAQQVIRQPAARDRQEIDHTHIYTVDGLSFQLTHPQPGIGRSHGAGHVQHQQSAHAVIGHTFPHFCQKQRSKPNRVSKKIRIG